MVNFSVQQVGEVLQRLYESEINILISSFWDAGFDWNLGDSMNGFTDASQNVRSWGIANTVDVLAFHAQKMYPESEFAKWYKQQEEAAAAPNHSGKLAG